MVLSKSETKPVAIDVLEMKQEEVETLLRLPTQAKIGIFCYNLIILLSF